MSSKVFRIGISGSYGGLNLGDEAILQSMVAQLRGSVNAEITVFSRHPKDTLKRHPIDRALPVREMSRREVIPEVGNLDLFILGGGGILFDGDAQIYLREVAIANELGVPVMLYAVGAGPLKDPSVQAEVRRCLDKVALITVRDRRSRHVLEFVGVEREIVVTADPALLLEPSPPPHDVFKDEGFDSSCRLVGISVREPGGAAPYLKERRHSALLANAADYIIERLDASVVFIPMEQSVSDLQQSHAVVAQMARPQRARILNGEYSAAQLLSLVGRFQFAVGMRLHFLIFSALQQVPLVALPYAPKVVDFMHDLEWPTPSLHQVNAGQLMAHIDRSWDRRTEFQTLLQKNIPILRERAKITNEMVLRLLQIK